MSVLLSVDRIEPGTFPHEADAEPVTVITWPGGAVELVLDDGVRLLLDAENAARLGQAALGRGVEAA